MLHFFHNFKISCKGNKKHSNNQIKIERYDAHFNLMFIIHTCDVFNRLNAIPPHTSLLFPSRPEGAEAPSPGHSPWVFMSPRLAPCRGKSFIWHKGETPTACVIAGFCIFIAGFRSYRRFSVSLSPFFGVIAGKVCNYSFIFIF